MTEEKLQSDQMTFEKYIREFGILDEDETADYEDLEGDEEDEHIV